MEGDNNIIAAIGAAIGFLRRQLMSGRYGLACTGRGGLPKFSNDKGHLFAIFHLISALGDEMTEIERTIFLMRILSEEYEGQWGYSPRGYYKDTGTNPFFVDADDTAFALRSLRALGIYRSPSVFLRYKTERIDSSLSQPAFLTFLADGGDERLSVEPSFASNFLIHPEVNANIYHCLLDSHLDQYISHEFISSAQTKEGNWLSYFYPDPYYGTSLFLNLLYRHSLLPGVFDSGILYLISQQRENGSWENDPYLSALALRALLLDHQHMTSIQKGVGYLLEARQTDGSWATGRAIWRFPDQDGDLWQAYDSNNVITTSLCVEVLKKYLTIMKTAG